MTDVGTLKKETERVYMTSREIKNVNLTIRVTPKELEQIREAAKRKDLPYSEFCMNAIRSAMGVTSQDEIIQSLVNRIDLLERRLADVEQVNRKAA